ncbi:MAG: bifunctional UDP-N-acetylmuramoyl-tripeptide:D-alanyl-D-alanine ligase/alanine racemase [Cyclobacteriaceae bacterium]|nr:bifunctional UDP-N-acetylmuramoyl-tripeptide:D-alanyl-D-alanine ligase/alanine racemase [Cyclobacteriaceae bacterium]UYN86923.1 MAG: bifunctional UDP-N-acetylmuramoyl-tripeptide:D-alanyl-D-alanine ligase/alanine racemase [Cyclobacteriaceae bacterium]
MNFLELPSITGGQVVNLSEDRTISYLLTDSRKPVLHEGSLFVAITGERHDGHDYIRQLYQLGVRQFIVERNYPWRNFPQANALQVSSSLGALQLIVAHHRAQFSTPVIGITGSNGKTIMKEWLFQLLGAEYNIIKSPGSFNSQLGVPLSVWQMQSHHQLGIFEAGISKPGEMEKLERIIKPTIGVFTNIGSAHDENFSNVKEKIEEKLTLFSHAQQLIYCADHEEIDQAVKAKKINAIPWGRTSSANIIVTRHNTAYSFKYGTRELRVHFPFTDAASIENASHCVAIMLVLQYDNATIQQRIQLLRSVPMRLELKPGINQCQVIDDSYNNDLAGLQMSLDFLKNQNQKNGRVVILSDILQSGLADETLVKRIADLVQVDRVDQFIGIGPVLSKYQHFFQVRSIFFTTTEEFLSHIETRHFQQQVILVKGARAFSFEKIVKRLERKVHGTIMEVNLNALVDNLNFFRSRIKPETKLMVMVKAFAYGSGSVEVANVLQFHNVDYLGVAYADEGVELRLNNITMPIMVMNPSPEGFQSMLQYNLEPEIYSTKILNELIEFLQGRPIGMHLKLDTGMHRLGFDEDDLDNLIEVLSKNKFIKVNSVFSHLAGSDDAAHDAFSHQQHNRFKTMVKKIEESLSISPLLHLLNTPGIMRFPEWQLNMVRLGIGLYGVDPTVGQEGKLKPVLALKTIISQIKNIKKGESVGYGRRGVADKEMKLATIAIGYADGFSRAFSRGVGKVLVQGKRAPVVGNVCMDMTMIDVTGTTAREGDEVIIFGKDLPVEELATSINTIPYEILTNTSERVKRVFIAESM